MVKHSAIYDAILAALVGLVACTTGVTTLSATATGYKRTTGSFIDDGFVVGMEVQPSGFTSNPPSVITSVTALEIVVADARTAQGAATGRALAVNCVPAQRAWENVDFVPSARAWYADLEYAPQSSVLRGQTLGGTVEMRALFFINLVGIVDSGRDALAQLADAILFKIHPATFLSVPTGERVEIRPDSMPYASQLRLTSGGRPAITVTIPVRLYTFNPVA